VSRDEGENSVESRVIFPSTPDTRPSLLLSLWMIATTNFRATYEEIIPWVIRSDKGGKIMNGVYCFARRIVSVVSLAMLVLAGWPELGHTQPTGIDPQAEKLLKRMSDYLASRQQFTAKAESTLEVVLTSGQKLQYDSPATLMVSRPNKLRAHRKGDLANQEFFYDGKTLTLYNPRENLYATTAAPPTLDETLDFAREKLDIIAPAAELLYKNAAEKMLKESSSGFAVGPSVVGGVKCTHLAFRGSEVDWQIWIEDGDKPLARKFILTSKKVAGEPQFTVLIRNWDVAPKLTNQEFSFTPPKGAKKIEFLQLTAEAAKPK
jgi:hypothetical protein